MARTRPQSLAGPGLLLVSLRFLLDTNTLSEPSRPSPDPLVLSRLEEHDGELAIAAPSWHGRDFSAFEGLRIEDWKS